MRERAISARALARRAGVDKKTVSRFLRSEGDTLPQTVIALCLALELDWYKRPIEEVPA